GPFTGQALHDQAADVRALRDARHFTSVAELEEVPVVALARGDADLPIGRRARGRGIQAIGLVLARRLATEAGGAVRTEDPFPPGIPGGRCGTAGDRRRTTERDVELRRRLRVRGVADEADSENAREFAPPLIGGRRLVGGEIERAIESLEPSEADELDDPGRTATAGVLCGDEHVEIGDRSIAHVVDEADVTAQVVDVALVTVQKDAERRGRPWRAAGLSSGWRA